MSWPTLRAGMSNRAVLALQNGLHRYLHEHGLTHEHKRNGGYGSQTIASVNRFKHHVGLRPVVGRVFGSAAWRALEPWLGEYDRKLVAKHLDDVRRRRSQREAAQLAGTSARERLVQRALAFHAARDRYVYRQVRPMPGCLICPDAYDSLDCSSTVTLIYREAGCDDPNGLGYSGQGFTGTLWARGLLVATPQPGDLAFYGYDSRGPYPSHVAIAISASEVVSFGSTPPRRAALRYRSDYRGSRSYL